MNPGSTARLPAMPFAQPDLLTISPQVVELQAECPVARIRTPTGDEAWMVTRYAELKQLFAERRLGRSHPDPQHAARISDSILFGGPSDNYATEAADDARLRSLLTPFFSARRMEELRPRVEAIADRLLDALAATAPPADLHEALSSPCPSWSSASCSGCRTRTATSSASGRRAWPTCATGSERPRRWAACSGIWASS